ncbi:hypothetical protein P9112_013497 [Eukaryota sp. TZLM1-RC]
MFGLYINPRSDPVNIRRGNCNFDSNVPLLRDLKFKNVRLQKKWKEAEHPQLLNTPKYLTTVEQTKVSEKDCKLYNADDPNIVNLLRAIAATSSGKHVIKKILDEYNTAQRPFCTVKWFGGDTTEEPLHSIRYSEVY